MHYTIQVKYILTNFLVDPAEISRILGIQPSRTWRKGEMIPKTSLPHKSNGWLLESGLSDKAEFEDHLDSLANAVAPAINKINQLPDGTEAEISCVIYIYHTKRNDEEHQTPALHLDLKHMELLNQLKVELDYDLYVLPE
jgi:hypothetical protein